jgi:hypothetical protein
MAVPPSSNYRGLSNLKQNKSIQSQTDFHYSDDDDTSEKRNKLE